MNLLLHLSEFPQPGETRQESEMGMLAPKLSIGGPASHPFSDSKRIPRRQREIIFLSPAIAGFDKCHRTDGWFCTTRIDPSAPVAESWLGEPNVAQHLEA